VTGKPTFKKAERRKAWLKLALTGPSGAGKTYSALLIAKGMGGRIAVIDTENESAQLYAGLAEMPEYDHLSIDPPYTVQKYADAIKAALEAGYENLIIDSISHAWQGEGGLLQQKEELDARGAAGSRKDKNNFTNWAPITKQHEQFKAWLLKADVHLIVTMRSKQDYVLADGNRPVKVGMAPIQRDGMEYEFTTVLDLAMNHSAQATKDRTGLFDSKIFQPSPETGKSLIDWLNGGAGDLVRRRIDDPGMRDQSAKNPQTNKAGGGAPSQPTVPPPVPTAEELGFNNEQAHAQAVRLLQATVQAAGWKGDEARAYAQKRYGKSEARFLSWAELNTLVKYFDENQRHVKAEDTGFAEVPPKERLPFEEGAEA
jgi:hypothetical protein